jgi:tetratricopeptide (TPR) repeat protein
MKGACRRIFVLLALLLFASAGIGCGTGDPVEQVRKLQAENRWEESVEQLVELIEVRRSDPEVHFLYGVALQRTGRPSLAVWPLQRAMQHPEWRARAGRMLGAGAIQTGNFDEAVLNLTAALEEDPEDWVALLMRLMARINTRRDYEGALEDADRLLEHEPDHPQARTYRAVALFALERNDEAKEAMLALDESHGEDVVEGPFSAGFCGARAKFAEESGDLEEAERRYRACLERFPMSAVVVQEAIQFFDNTGRRDDGTSVLREAHESAPRDQALRVHLAARLESLGDFEGAEELLRQATRDVEPLRAAKAHADLAAFLVQHQRAAEGAAEYQHALDLTTVPADSLLFSFVDSLILAGELAQALEVVERIRVAPMRHVLRGRALLQQGHVRESLHELTAGLVDWPNQPAARYYAALAAERLGDLDRAIEEYRYAIRAKGSPEANLRLARLHYALGNLEYALTALRQGGTNMSTEAALLEVEVAAANSAGFPQLRPILQTDETREASLAALARGWRSRVGPGGAAQVLLDRGLDVKGRLLGPALAVLVDDLIETDRSQEALELVDAVLKQGADQALPHALRGQVLEALASDGSLAKAAFERALELDATLSRALEGMARQLVREGDRVAALDYYDRAIANATPHGAGAATLASAELLLQDGKRREAIDRLQAWLDRRPLDAQVALRLAELLSNEASEQERALVLAEVAVRLRAGNAAEQLADRRRGAR